MSPEMLIGLSLSGVLILLFGNSPAPKAPTSPSKTVATLVISGAKDEIFVVEKNNDED